MEGRGRFVLRRLPRHAGVPSWGGPRPIVLLAGGSAAPCPGCALSRPTRPGLRCPRLRRRSLHRPLLGSPAPGVRERARCQAAKGAIEAFPATHLGWPTRIGSDNIPFRTHVDVWTVSEWCGARLGVDPRHGLCTLDWLALPQQLLLETTAGRVFHDGLDQLEPIRASLTWYPHDVWLWLVAAQWTRVAQEEAFVGPGSRGWRSARVASGCRTGRARPHAPVLPS